MSDDMPDSPFTDLQSNAIQMHETMSSLIQAGFTPDQAFAILQNILSSYILAQGRQT